MFAILDMCEVYGARAPRERRYSLTHTVSCHAFWCFVPAQKREKEDFEAALFGTKVPKPKYSTNTSEYGWGVQKKGEKKIVPLHGTFAFNPLVIPIFLRIHTEKLAIKNKFNDIGTNGTTQGDIFSIEILKFQNIHKTQVAPYITQRRTT